MRIAIAAQDDQGLDGVAAHHFGRCPYYLFVDVEDDRIENVEVRANPYYERHTPGQVPAFIHQQGADVMVSGGMGRRAIGLFERYGIQTYTGAAGTVRRALEQALGGALEEAAPCREPQCGPEETAKPADHEPHGEVGRMREEVAALREQVDAAAARLDKATS